MCDLPPKVPVSVLVDGGPSGTPGAADEGPPESPGIVDWGPSETPGVADGGLPWRGAIPLALSMLPA